MVLGPRKVQLERGEQVVDLRSVPCPPLGGRQDGMPADGITWRFPARSAENQVQPAEGLRSGDADTVPIRYVAPGGGYSLTEMILVAVAAFCLPLLIIDLSMYEATGASDCIDCSIGQLALGWGLILLPLTIVVCLLIAAVRAFRRRA